MKKEQSESSAIDPHPRRIVVCSGGVGGARFLWALRSWNRTVPQPAQITAVVNVADDFTHLGLRISPDLDSVLYRLAGVSNLAQGWGRAGDTATILEELRHWQATGMWFSLGDRDIAMSLLRTQLLGRGLGLAAVTAQLAQRWPIGVELLPATEHPVETRVLLEPSPDRPDELGFQEWWVRHRAALPARGFRFSGIEAAEPGPGVLEAIAAADLLLLAPSNPIVSLDPVLRIPGILPAIHESSARVLGLSPIIGGSPVRGYADRCLEIAGVPATALGVAGYFGARSRPGDRPGLLDGWLIDHRDRQQLPALRASGLTAAAASIIFAGDHRDHSIIRRLLSLAKDADIPSSE